MAKSEIYYKWSSNGDGQRGGGGWSGPIGTGQAGGGGGVAASRNHAERVAWKEARAAVLAAARQGPPSARDYLQVKIWVDQQICPQCQKWMVVDVLSQIKVVQTRVDLFVEVKFAGATRRLRVQRSAEWPTEIGGVPTFDEMPEDYYS